MGSLFSPQGITSTPQSQQISNNGIASWAQPYVNNYLNQAQNLVNNFQPTSFQNQVASSAQNMGTPDQFGQGSNLAQQGGQGALSTAPQALSYGQQGAAIGSQGLGYGAAGANYGFNAGANYAQQATNPSAVGAYMNPYVQQALAPQLQLLNQQQQIQNQNIAGQATGQGAFGGNRATLAQGLNNQNYALAEQNAIGQGYNTAFQNAQQAQQFGANLGLQGAMQGTNAGLAGLQTGLQGINTGLQGVQGAQQGYTGATQAGAALGNIGAQQGQYQLGLLGLQNQIANQQQQLPYQNLQFAQGMLSGLPISTNTTQGYQAAPNTLSQIAGLGTSLVGGYGLYNKLFGGNNPSTPTTPTSNGTTSTTDSYGNSTFSLNNGNGSISTSMPISDQYDNIALAAKGGKVKSKNYAGGGLVSLAIKNAMKG